VDWAGIVGFVPCCYDDGTDIDLAQLLCVIWKNGLLTTLGYKIGNQPAVYCLEGSIAITGALVQWLRDNLGLIEKSSDVEELAKWWKTTAGFTSSRPSPVCLPLLAQ
jgi:glycerol kinase